MGNFWFKLTPYLLLGITLFALNSHLELNYFLKGYLVLLESQIGFLLIYFLMRRIFHKRKSHQSAEIR